MSYTIRKKSADYHNYLRLVERNVMDDNGQPKPEFEQVTMTFLCPPGFEPAAFLITAMNKEGKSFTNAPTDQPALALRLATLAVDFASQHAIVHIQAEKKQTALIQRVPAGTVPTSSGPEGRG